MSSQNSLDVGTAAKLVTVSSPAYAKTEKRFCNKLGLR